MLKPGERNLNKPNGLIKHVFQPLLRERRALKVSNSTYLLSSLHTLGIRDWRHSLFAKALGGLGIVAKIELGTDEDYGDVGSMVRYLGEPLNVSPR